MMPDELIQWRGSLSDALYLLVRNNVLADADAQTVLAYLPCPLVSSPFVITAFNPTPHYVFGRAFDRLPGDTRVFGSPQMPRVEWLARAILTARRFLTEAHRELWLNRLADLGRHRDALDEMLPLAYAPEPISAEFEVAGLGNGNTTIDWRITAPGLPEILLDVKYRLTDLIVRLEQTVPGLNAGHDHIPAAPPDATRLFRSIEEKFVATDPRSRIQGAWITPGLKHTNDGLAEIFRSLDPAKVHFVLVGDWNGVRFPLGREGIDLNAVVSALRIPHTEER